MLGSSTHQGLVLVLVLGLGWVWARGRGHGPGFGLTTKEMGVGAKERAHLVSPDR